MSLKDFQQTTALGPDALFLLENATLDTRPGRYHEPKQIVINALPLTKVPVAMRKMGWHTSAALMQRWFDSPGWQMPEAWKQTQTQPDPAHLNNAQCDEHIVKMDWAMNFQRCREAVAVAESRLSTPNTAKRLKVQLEKAGWRNEASFKLGSTDMTAKEMDGVSQVNFSRLGDEFDVLDDMYGALGFSTVKIGVVGKTFNVEDPITGNTKPHFKIEHIGLYIRDNYEFNGFQFLGIWTADRVLTKAEMLRAALPSGQSIYKWSTDAIALVENDDFRKYRNKTAMGGDYVLYSDILWKKIDKIVDLSIVS
ncbi:DUF6402 family protein [Pseudomonas sp. zfem002]|uniref:DUF6402 family protein n=1 Tax=Pseudomonas sp. zfem002 TaxID=3078197 RepID=UPI002929FC97|nr:DUF6402 family protein [Pseudomonas sp. zfem002]MDU9394012.1 DUF6402 family protein [Pseudomonas sp. zfem002]